MNKSDLAAQGMTELRELAKRLSLRVPARVTKKALIDLLVTAENEAREATDAQPRAVEPAPSKVQATPATHTVPRDAPTSAVAPAERRAERDQVALPHEYGDNKIVLMPRDPYWAHAYWEVTPERLEHGRAALGGEGRLCLRVYDVTGVAFDGTNALRYTDQEIFERIGNYYFELGAPTRSFCVDVGLVAASGKFLTLARSNLITLPRDGASDVVDEEWMLVDEHFWKLYRGAGGPSSVGGEEEWRRRRREEMSSPGMRMAREHVASPGMRGPRGS